MKQGKRVNKKNLGFLDGLKFEAGTLRDLSSTVLLAKGANGNAYHLVNAHTLVEAHEDSSLYSILSKDILLCDGKPLSFFLSRMDPSVKQVRGADFMRHVLVASSSSTRHYLLGSTNEVLDELIKSIKAMNPEANVVGYHSPAFEVEYLSSVPVWIEMIKKSQASIVWVGLGTPKQDFVSHEIAKSISCEVIAVGAAFDYLAHTISEAPKLFQILYLEWLWRLFKEPRRLMRRYLVGNLKFIRIMVLQLIHGNF